MDHFDDGINWIDDIDDDDDIEDLIKDKAVAEFLRQTYGAVLQEIEKRNDEDYEVNKPQMAKLIRAYQFFKKVADRDHGTVEPFDITPKMEHSGITAYFRVFLMTRDEMKEFAEIVGDMSSLYLDATLEGEVCISFNIPNVFRLKKKD